MTSDRPARTQGTNAVGLAIVGPANADLANRGHDGTERQCSRPLARREKFQVRGVLVEFTMEAVGVARPFGTDLATRPPTVGFPEPEPDGTAPPPLCRARPRSGTPSDQEPRWQLLDWQGRLPGERAA